MSDGPLSGINNPLLNFAPILQPADSNTTKAVEKRLNIGNAQSLILNKGGAVLSTDVGQFNINLPPSLANYKLQPTTLNMSEIAGQGLQTAANPNDTANFNAFMVLIALMEAMGVDDKAEFLRGYASMKGNVSDTLASAAQQKKAAMTEAIGGIASGAMQGLGGIASVGAGTTEMTTGSTTTTTPAKPIDPNAEGGLSGAAGTEGDAALAGAGTQKSINPPEEKQSHTESVKKTKHNWLTAAAPVLEGGGRIFDSLAKMSASTKRQEAAALDAQAQVLQSCMKNAGQTADQVMQLMQQVTSIIQAQGAAARDVLGSAGEGMQAGV